MNPAHVKFDFPVKGRTYLVSNFWADGKHFEEERLVKMDGYKFFNDAPWGTECYTQDGVAFYPEDIISIKAFPMMEENE